MLFRFIHDAANPKLLHHNGPPHYSFSCSRQTTVRAISGETLISTHYLKSGMKFKVSNDIGFLKFLNDAEFGVFSTWNLWAVDSTHLFTPHTLQTHQGDPFINLHSQTWLQFPNQVSGGHLETGSQSQSPSMSLWNPMLFPSNKHQVLFKESEDSVYSQWLKDEYMSVKKKKKL